MALRYALLGLLTKKPSTGYELNQKFKETMIHYWNAHHTQIYRELIKLEEEGWVSSIVYPQVDSPDKKVYEIKDDGREELLKWLLNYKVEPPKLKDQQLLRVSMFHLIDSDDAIRFLQQSKEHHKIGLQHMYIWQEHEYRSDKDIKAALGEYFTSEFGKRYMETWIEWCDWAIDVLQRLKD
ncbi:PadR family transcriptional regulator [Pseudalkalibacillus berkeleyi]|uniref:PadR family transcriptional regulator n=1 Tax=Pseudalkalibacillus berkeleyi TaxID=1069813 RepID=A0ABS9H1H4_9BACL|nr:PadR family transcriptional regulator [Pseudalkalibacillus berkeleyi]MCF6137675.1 PadR family transcriptional regulator [Pseudalkalibacillus berkeleyi]